MESANLHHHHHHQHHHHQLQDQQLNIIGSSSLASPTLHGVGLINNSSWNPNLILNNNAGNFNGVLPNSRDLRQNDNDLHHHHHHQVPTSLSCSTTSMVDHQDLGFHHWGTTTTGRSFINDLLAPTSHELHLAKIKKELISSEQYSHHDQEGITNYLDEFHLAASEKNYFKHEELQDLQDLNSSTTIDDENRLFLRNLISSGGQDLYCNSQNNSADFAQYSSNRSAGNNFSQIFPSTNILSPNPNLSSLSSFPSTRPSGMNYQALDLLSSSSTKIGGISSIFGQPLLKESLSSFDHHLDQHDLQIRSSSLNWPITTNSPTKVASSCLMNLGAGREITTPTKRSSSCSGSNSSGGLATKASHAAAPKKPRLESRSSFPPIKVRKEKLGDRIANLQQLVAPFGKTDTASVLMEAIGYIKFLQEQVETLSVPYMKPLVRNNIRPKIQRGSTAGEGEIDEPKRDLRSRGLCLVPLSCTSYINTNDLNLGVNWSSPHYGGIRP